MFETFAVLSTLTCIGIFIALFQMDRAARRDDSKNAEESTRQPGP